MSDQIGLSVQRMLHVPPEIDDMRGAHADLAAILAAFAEQRARRTVWRFLPGPPAIAGHAEADERPQNIPVPGAAIGGGAPGLIEAIGTGTRRRHASGWRRDSAHPVGGGTGIFDAEVLERKVKRVVASYAGVACDRAAAAPGVGWVAGL